MATISQPTYLTMDRRNWLHLEVVNDSAGEVKPDNTTKPHNRTLEQADHIPVSAFDWPKR